MVTSGRTRGLRRAEGKPFEMPNSPSLTISAAPAKPGEVLVKIRMSTICRSDIHSYRGHRPNPCPGVLGHEIIGTIVSSARVSTKDMRGDSLAVGDRITWSEYFIPGDNYYTRSARPAAKIAWRRQVRSHGGHDRAAPSRRLRRVLLHPAALVDPQAAGGAERRGSDADQLRRRDRASASRSRPRSRMGDAVVVQGLGLLGLYGCAHREGARRPAGDRARQRCQRAAIWHCASAPIRSSTIGDERNGARQEGAARCASRTARTR